MAQRTYSQRDIETLLKAIDKRLTKKCEVVVIGGAAAALAYHAVKYTVDIDTAGSIRRIARAYDEAKKDTGLDIPLGPAGVWNAPHDYEERLQELRSLGLKKLRVLVPEVHDLILMKVVRGNAHDLEQIKQIHAHQKLNPDILVERFRNEMKHVVGNARTLQLNFLAMIAECFGDERAAQIEQRLK